MMQGSKDSRKSSVSNLLFYSDRREMQERKERKEKKGKAKQRRHSVTGEGGTPYKLPWEPRK